MRRSTHAGAIVFRRTRGGPRYLLVEARGTRGRWIFPKGHVEDGETAVEAARREVAEEAGVRAQPLRRLRRVAQKQRGETISVAYFLMAYAGRTAPSEERRVRWLALDDAVEALDLGKNRRLLRYADRAVAPAANGKRDWRRSTRRASVRLADWLTGIATFLRRARNGGKATAARRRRGRR